MKKWSDVIYDKNTNFTTPLPDENFLALLPKNVKILDIGCGYGRTLQYLNNLGFYDLTGFDISSDYVAKTKKDCPLAKVFVSDFKDYNLKDKYDLILLMGVVEYILTDKEQKIFFDKISKNLSEDGRVLLETFVMDIKSGWRQYLFGFVKTLHFGRFNNGKGFDCFHQSSASLRKILKKYFFIEYEIKKEYLTWTNNLCKGHYFVLRQKKI
jgi:cyclopropane fatty-acyl-phospholipid synthase-like methyltransferase